MSVIRERIDQITIAVITTVAALLRFWDVNNIPFVQDELSTLVRTNYDSIWEVILQAYYSDVHPIGIQILVYLWTSIFGYATWVVKLPFLIMGTASIPLTYLIGKKWFSKEVGWLSASFLAVIQYHVMYSQSIRPYGAGTFFILALIWFWGEVILFKKWNAKNLIGIIGFALASYLTHYFANILAGIILLSGFLFIDKSERIKWLKVVGISILIYLPHLPIFAKHLLFGTPGEWLAAPGETWFHDYFFFIFHFSWLFVGTFLLSVVYGWWSERKSTSLKLRLVMISWFALPLIIGYAYSILRNPMLQYSVVLFGLPSLFIALFSIWGKTERAAVVSMIILVVGSSTLIFGREYFLHYYNGGYDTPFTKVMERRKDLNEDIPLIYRSSDMVKFYLEKKYSDLGNTFFEENLDRISGMDSFVDRQNSDHLALAIPWSDNVGWYAPYRHEYPFLIERFDAHLKRYLLISKNSNSSSNENDTSFFSSAMSDSHWKRTKGTVLRNDSNGKNIFISGEEFPIGLDIDPESVISHPGQIINFYSIGRKNYQNAKLVLELLDSNGKSLLYKTDDRSKGNLKVLSLEPGRDLYEKLANGRLKVYLWNPAREEIILEDLFIIVRKENPLEFWLLEDFKHQN